MSVSDATDATQNGATPRDPFAIPADVLERLETLMDGVATANRAAIANRQEIAALRGTLIFALILVGTIYVRYGKAVTV